MSYCVNCGVELDKTCGVCPLCNTVVYNPKQPVDTESPKPFPARKGTVEPVKRYEFTIFMSIFFFTTAFICGILNNLVFTSTHWSFYVIGLCVILWVFLLPTFFPDKISFFLALILDGISICAYFAIISYLHPGNGWYLHIALPITILATIIILNFYLFSFRRKSSFITKAALMVGSLALLCVTIELLIHAHNQRPLFLSWSAIVLTCCIAIDVILVTIACLKGIRSEIRRRMHF